MLIDKLYGGGFLPTKIYSELERRYKWSRAARTDKGVHAVFNAISCTFLIDKMYYTEDRIMDVKKLDAQFR